jgi:hypothetical protein
MPVEQPAPIPNDARPVWEVVIEDMQKRDHVGRARYGTTLQPNNGRDALRDAYEEALDLAVYLRQAIIERDARGYETWVVRWLRTRAEHIRRESDRQIADGTAGLMDGSGDLCGARALDEAAELWCEPFPPNPLAPHPLGKP